MAQAGAALMAQAGVHSTYLLLNCKDSPIGIDHFPLDTNYSHIGGTCVIDL